MSDHPETPRWASMEFDEAAQSRAIVDRPSLDDVTDAIDRLDGATRSLVSISIHDALLGEVTALLIGGGSDGRVSVARLVRDADGDFDQNWTMLTDLGRGDELEARVIGGQLTELAARLWAGKDDARRAAAYFLEHHDIDPGLSWASTWD